MSDGDDTSGLDVLGQEEMVRNYIFVNVSSVIPTLRINLFLHVCLQLMEMYTT